MRRLLWVLALAGCTGAGPEIFNEPPVVTLTAPAQDARLLLGADLVVRGRVSDFEDDAVDLDVAFTHVDGTDLGGAVAWGDDEVTLTVPGGLPEGAHSVTLTATDTQAATSHDSVDFQVVAGVAPTVTFFAPSTSALHISENPIAVEARFTDPDEGDLAQLALTWSGAAAGAGPASPDSTGTATFELLDLPAGANTVAVTVTDSTGGTGTGSVSFDVIEADKDDDGVLDPAFGGTDCDDNDPTVYPGAPETCDGVDDDCDGIIDDGASDPQEWFADDDSDGFGDAADSTVTCTPPAGHVADDTDCDDTDGNVHPGAAEVCDGQDQDCDGTADDGVLDTFFRDQDADGYGDPANSQQGCTPTSGFTDDDTDCDDGDANIFPGAPERCNGLDDDCDAALPSDESTDADGDGYALCDDCDDGRAASNPAGTEVCNGHDDDCAGGPDDTGCACPVRVYAGRPYQFCGSLVTWWDAQSACAADGYHLLELANASEDDWVNDRIDELPFGYWWMGLNDQAIPGTWVWEDGTPATYLNWGPSEPNNLLGNEACVELNRFDPANGWNDQPCDYQWKYVCEFGG